MPPSSQMAAVLQQARQMPHLLPHHPAPGAERQGGQRGAADAGAEEDMGHGVLVRDLQPVWQEGTNPEGQTGSARRQARRWVAAAVSTLAATARMQLSYAQPQDSSRQPVSSNSRRQRCSPAGCPVETHLSCARPCSVVPAAAHTVPLDLYPGFYMTRDGTLLNEAEYKKLAQPAAQQQQRPASAQQQPRQAAVPAQQQKQKGPPAAAAAGGGAVKDKRAAEGGELLSSHVDMGPTCAQAARQQLHKAGHARLHGSPVSTTAQPMC
jgi:hypothetical protein